MVVPAQAGRILKLRHYGIPIRYMITKEEITPLLSLREEQIGSHTDTLLIRNIGDGACGQASCLYLRFNGHNYAVSCSHVVKDKSEYFTGSKRLRGTPIEKAGSHRVPPLQLIRSDSALDLAAFTHFGLDLAKIPKCAYDLSSSPFTYENTAKDIGTLSFIYGVPAFLSYAIPRPDEGVYLCLPIYTVCGPITQVCREWILADFPENEPDEVNPEITDFAATGGARDISGMSGSGLWVMCEDRFHLSGILSHRTSGYDTSSSHIISFTPVWVLKAWLQTLNVAGL